MTEASAPSRSAATDQDIYDRVYEAILDRRLQPGAHLREAELAEVFGVSRTKVRQALVKLFQDGVVEMRPNRGAVVTAPSRAQAGHVFALRSMLEPEIAAECARRHNAVQMRSLWAHVAAEDAARARGDEPGLIRSTGEFHLKLAATLGNPLTDKLLRDLEALTCLSILSYAQGDNCACLPDEHRSILDAIERRDAAKARQLMATHLEHVRSEITGPPKSPPTLQQALRLDRASRS